MKKSLIGIVCLLVLHLCANATDIEDLQVILFRKICKEELFKSQFSISDKDQYQTFIEPYLIKAEKELTIHEHLLTQFKENKAIETLPVFHLYFTNFKTYLMADFWHYIKPDSNPRKEQRETAKYLLKSTIDYIKKLYLPNLDVDKELSKTTTHIDTINHTYYAQLGSLSKFAFYLTKYLAN